MASYLLAPGFFQERVGAAGADAVTEPVAADPRLVELVLDRYDSGVALLEGHRGAAGAPPSVDERD